MEDLKPGSNMIWFAFWVVPLKSQWVSGEGGKPETGLSWGPGSGTEQGTREAAAGLTWTLLVLSPLPASCRSQGLAPGPRG